ncbi:Os02g0668500 [Oryza sativa Japonica Group]|jgi:hypothetical protein|uniref:Os02g0668500 protein n=2 Tax=Oryza sativa subsp. japonica TaxID=39947 RepID=A0A0P0VMS8_ORYSJ|nr:hypothetical protein EE612_012909 [Oryza sativa]KAF2946278.1 hypothetical protein DAI22_02g281050 [Oryza sativa Japonica Group]BAS80214.1 Os02g0668500 [Oryza sativa Japonica Group]
MVDLIHETDDAMAEAELLLERSRAITLNGRDKRGRALVRIVGKYFPGKLSSASLVRSPQFRCFCRRKSDPVSFVAAARALGGRAEAALRGYVRRRVLPEIGEREFVVVYVHSLVDRGDNFPGVAAIRAAYEALPAAAKERLRAVYFVHPGFQARLFFATLGRFLFSSGYVHTTNHSVCAALRFVGEALVFTVVSLEFWILQAVREAEVHEQARVPVGAREQGGDGGPGMRAPA